MDYKAVLEILRFVTKSDLTEVEYQQGETRLVVKRGPEGVPMMYAAPAPAPEATAYAPVAAPPAPAAPSHAAPTAPVAEPVAAEPAGEAVLSPMVGTFYRSPGPDKAAFVEVGDTVKVGDTLCIIEAMKLFNEIESEVAGRVVKIMVENAKPVEFEQPLFIIEPL
jgi:acetyl-CoA carboxylase biotin carboxyl carrier protein